MPGRKPEKEDVSKLILIEPNVIFKRSMSGKPGWHRRPWPRGEIPLWPGDPAGRGGRPGGALFAERRGTSDTAAGEFQEGENPLHWGKKL